MPTHSTSSAKTEESQIQQPRPQPSKISLVYDMLMVVSVLASLVLLAVQYILNADFGWITDLLSILKISASQERLINISLKNINHFITGFLVIELLVRWILAIIRRSYFRWFFFPFIHWYEVLGCLPILRPLRLFRTFIIAYRLYLLGYSILPSNWIIKGRFYYDLVLEELSDRIVLRVLDGISSELKQNKTHYVLLDRIIETHRPQLIQVFTEILESNLPSAIQKNQLIISQYVANAVERSLQNTPELQQMLHLIPVVGNLISQRLESVSSKLAENMTLELIQPLTQPPYPIYSEVAQQIGSIHLHTPEFEALVNSIVIEAIDVIHNQVSIQQWKIPNYDSTNHENAL
jgi:hypothetical protein